MFQDNSYIQQRIEKAALLKEAGLNPYDNQTSRDTRAADFRQSHAALLTGGEPDEQRLFTLAGRVKLLRWMGKAAFATIEDESGPMQVYFNKNALEDRFAILKKTLEVGDIIEAKGFGFMTRTGELTLNASQSLKVLTKAIAPLPEKFHGLQDVELRYRQRYLDLIMNPEVRENFALRSRIISHIRRFFEDRQFLEVETPMLHPIPGGANARPFVTHHNALGVDRYLRIAPELYLKRLIVGGFEAVFEINRNFRNEGMDATHNPEFTMIEFYWAYKRCEHLVEITETLISDLITALKLPESITFRGHSIHLKAPFKRYTYDEALVQIGGLDPAILGDLDGLKARLKEAHIEPKGEVNIGSLKADLFDHLVEDRLIDPTFITDFPIEISPLARRKDENPAIADRFELFIGGYEIANGFSELSDPVDQYERFSAQVAAKEAGDDEGMFMDEDFVTALSYGMPPAAGEGIGIDRLVMVLSGQDTIRDVLLFPAMRPIKQKTDEE